MFDRGKADRLTSDLFYGIESIALDDASKEHGLWQGGFIPRKLEMVNELRELLGFERRVSILDGEGEPVIDVLHQSTAKIVPVEVGRDDILFVTADGVSGISIDEKGVVRVDGEVVEPLKPHVVFEGTERTDPTPGIEFWVKPFDGSTGTPEHGRAGRSENQPPGGG